MRLLNERNQPQWLQRHLEYHISVVLGGLWGDEGKGKIVDWLMEHSDVVIRFNGGHNAGHTVSVNGQKFDLHILPSGSVREGKINIITSGCVLGLDLPKVDLGKMICASESGELVFNATMDDLRKRYTEKDQQEGKGIKGEPVRAGLIPELEQLIRKGVNVHKEPVKISAQTPLIGVHHVLLDALEEEKRKAQGLEKIGSTGSGIAPAYASKREDNCFSLETLLNSPDTYYDAVRTLWKKNAHHFPNISADELVSLAREDYQRLQDLISQGKIEIIQDERSYIDNLKSQGKRIVAEGAQGALIGANYSPFGTSSSPDLPTFCDATGINIGDIGNLFTVFKMPPSSVGTRPQMLAYIEDEILNQLRANYNERGVTSGRDRQIFGYSLPEFAKAMALMIAHSAFPMDRVVPVFNGVDRIPDFARLEKGGIPRVITGWKYRHGISDVLVGLRRPGMPITPEEALHNYPNRDLMGSPAVFASGRGDLHFRKIQGRLNGNETPKGVSEATRELIGMILASMFTGSKFPEAIFGFGPDRHQSSTYSHIDIVR